MDKYEIAQKLGIDLTGENLTASQAGKVGGLVAKKKKIEKKNSLKKEEPHP